MNLSGIVVGVPPEYLDITIETLNRLQGVEVHAMDRDTGRIVVVQEAPTVDDEISGLKKIKGLEHVVMAELVYHYFGDDEQSPELGAVDGAGALEGVCVRLNDPIIQ